MCERLLAHRARHPAPFIVIHSCAVASPTARPTSHVIASLSPFSRLLRGAPSWEVPSEPSLSRSMSVAWQVELPVEMHPFLGGQLNVIAMLPQSQPVNEGEGSPRGPQRARHVPKGSRAAAAVSAMSSATESGKKRGTLQRCSQCVPCTRSDCGECQNCLDKPKFGGPGLRKQACEKKRCLTMTTRYATPSPEHTTLGSNGTKSDSPTGAEKMVGMTSALPATMGSGIGSVWTMQLKQLEQLSRAGATAPLPALRSMSSGTSSGLGYSLAGLECPDLLGCNFGAVPGVMGSISGLGSSLFGSSMDVAAQSMHSSIHSSIHSAGLDASSVLLSAPERASLSHPQPSPRHHIRASSLHASHVSMGSHVPMGDHVSSLSLRSPATALTTARPAHPAPDASTLVGAVVSATEDTAAELQSELQSYAPFARRPALEPPDAAYSQHETSETSFESAHQSSPSFGSFSSLSRPADPYGIDEPVNPAVEEDYKLWLADDY
jgi:hypothetical protein